MAKIPTRPKRTTHSEAELRQIRSDLRALERLESEALNLYEANPIQEKFHACESMVRTVLGGNRSGKTTVGAVEFSRGVLGRDPYGKYPKVNGRALIVGEDHRHIGLTVYPKLFRAGAFKMIRDVQTNRWRAFNPNNPEDRVRTKDAKPAPPLIPQRYIKDIAWYKKAEKQFSSVTLKNGWEIITCSSKGDPVQGIDVDLIWVDEDIDSSSDFYSEMMPRLLDRMGKLFWTATPHSTNDDLLHFQELAEDQVGQEEPEYSTFVMTMLDNMHLDDKYKTSIIKALEKKGEEVVRMRVYGEFNYDRVKWFPKFNERVHAIKWSDLPNNCIPQEWTRYVSIDPGYTTACALFFAVPPDQSRVVLFDELYETDCSAERFAELMKLKTSGFQVQEFVIDDHGSRGRSAGSGRSILDHYMEECKAAGVVPARKRWAKGNDDIEGRNECGRQWLELQEETGQPYFQYVDGMVPNFVTGMKRYRRKKDSRGIVTNKPAGRDNHAPDCFAYMAAHDPPYVKPKPQKNWAQRRADKIFKRKKKDAKNYISLGAA